MADSTNVEVKKELVTMYQKYFGSTTAQNYAEFYADKDLAIVLDSANELMSEYAGETKGREIMEQIYKKYNLKKN
jgi:hypothetical protein